MKGKHFAFVIIMVSIIASSCAKKESEKVMTIQGEQKIRMQERKLLTITKTGKENGPVSFDHPRHKQWAMDKQKCETCHHPGTKKLSQPCSDAGCHIDPVKDAGGARLHVTCIEKCHTAKAGSAPTTCKECHK